MERLKRAERRAVQLFKGTEMLERRQKFYSEGKGPFEDYELHVLETIMRHPLYDFIPSAEGKRAALGFGLAVASYVKSEIMAGKTTSDREVIREQQKLALETAGQINSIEFVLEIVDLAFETTEKAFKAGE